MKPGLADMKNAVVVPHIASASKVCRNGGSQSSCCDESYYIWEDKDTTTDTTIAIILLVSSVDTWRNGNAGCSQRSCKSAAAVAVAIATYVMYCVIYISADLLIDGEFALGRFFF